MKSLRKLFDWLGRTDVLECDGPLASALPPYDARRWSPLKFNNDNSPGGRLAPDYDARPWPVCTPRIGETYARYRERARRSRERALLAPVWRVTAEPDRSGEWKTAHDGISRKRDQLLHGDGFAS